MDFKQMEERFTAKTGVTLKEFAEALTHEPEFRGLVRGLCDKTLQAEIARLEASRDELLAALEKLMHETDRGTNLCARHIADEADALIAKAKV